MKGNYKTTIIGVLGAIFIAIQPLFTAKGFDISTDWKSLVSAAIVAAFAFVAKDFDVTGGTVVNPVNDPTAVAKSASK